MIPGKKSSGALPSAAAHDVMDRLPIGIVLLDAEGKALSANAEARVVLEAGWGLVIADGRLCAVAAGEQPRLQEAIGEVLAASSGQRALALRRAAGTGHLEVLVSAIRREWRGLRGALAAAVVFVSDPDRNTSIAPHVIRELYGLTRRESSVAELLVRGLTVNQIAERLGVTRETIRTHLKRVHSKTGTRRESDLVRQLLMGPGGLRGG